MKYQGYEQRRQAVIAYIVEYVVTNDCPPSGHEIAAGCGITSTYAYNLLDRMEKEGLITRPRVGGRPVGRNLRLTKAAMVALKEEM